MPEIAYRCGLPAAMCLLAIGSVGMVLAAGVVVAGAVQSILGVGPAGQRARAFGLQVRR